MTLTFVPYPPPPKLLDEGDLTVWEFPDAVVIRVGPAGTLGVQTLDLPKHLFQPLGRLLLMLDQEGCDA